MLGQSVGISLLDKQEVTHIMSDKVLQVAINPEHFFGVNGGITSDEIGRLFEMVSTELTTEIKEHYPDGRWQVQLDFADREGIDKLVASMRAEINKFVVIRMADRFACIVNGRPPKKSQQAWIDDAMSRAKDKLRRSMKKR